MTQLSQVYMLPAQETDSKIYITRRLRIVQSNYSTSKETILNLNSIIKEEKL